MTGVVLARRRLFVGRVVALATLLGCVAVGAVSAIGVGHGGVATVDAPAKRDVQFGPDAVCDTTTVTALASRHPDVRQFVIMKTTEFAATSGTVEVAVRTADGEWRCQLGAKPARFGRSGTRPLPDRRSGDGTTPAGVFPLGVVEAWDGQTFSIFGNHPDPGTLAPYRAVRYEDCWGATRNTSRYQHLVNLPNCSGPDEWLPRFGDVYSHAAVIGANLDPISGDAPGETPYAAAIFLHRHSFAANGATKPTSGCVSLAMEDLVATVTLLDPRLSPHFAIGPTSWLRSSA
jgi:L,D-peptidoglycan transpeptidase YkuD (ErfK/YbiS/YcfS/YnhG family)